MTPHTVDDLSPSIVRDNTKCVLCRRCVAVCHKVQNVGVIGPAKRGFNTSIESRLGAFAGRQRLHQLRPVHRGVPHRRAATKRTIPTRCGMR